MNADTRMTPEPLSLIRRVDAVCCRFERAWREGGRPRVEDFLADLPEPERGPLLRELVLLDADYRRRTGDSPEPKDYLSRFPALDATWLAEVGTARQTEGDSPGDSIRYRVLRPHARGGLGVVYVALDRELGREVALKEILPDQAADPHSRRRFVFEAEVTGSLEHPGVVPVYGLGSYEDGRPFYAMRFIQGDSLDAAIRRFHEADRPGGDPGERGLEFHRLLRRFVDVCNAVAYAHSRGVVHRDLKPSNIMLGPFGETLVVDWGMAKAVPGGPAGAENAAGPGSGGPADLSHSGMVLGSPAYMSPEQAARRHGEVGPASDVYGLGATLFHLLTGRAAVEGGGMVEILRRVQHGEVPPARQVNPDVPAALEAVCQKAMALRPADRYATPLALAADIEHWLADEPVSCWREPLALRTRRWARRHRTLATSVAAALAVAVLLLAGAAVVLEDARAKEHQARLDEADQRRAAQASEAVAQKSQRQTEVVAAYLVDIFRSPDPTAGGRDLKVGDLLDQAARQLETDTASDAGTRARLLDALGRTYHGLGVYDRAAGLLEQALALGRGTRGPDDAATVDTLASLVEAYLHAERPADAVPAAEELRRRREEKSGPDHADTILAAGLLARAYRSAKRHAEALTLAEDAWRRAEARLPPHDPTTLMAMLTVAVVRQGAGRPDEALPLAEEVLLRAKGNLPPDHRVALSALNNLAQWYRQAGRPKDAVQVAEEVLRRREARLGSQHPHTLLAMGLFAEALEKCRRYDEALAVRKTAYEIHRRRFGPDDPATIKTMINLVREYNYAGRPAEAVRLGEEALGRARVTLEAGDVFLVDARLFLAGAYEDTDRPAEAVPLYEEIIRTVRDPLSGRPNTTAVARARLGRCLVKAGRCAEAEPILREALAALEKALPGDWIEVHTQATLGAALASQRKYAEAEPYLTAGYDRLRALVAKRPHLAERVEPSEALDRVIRLYDDWGRPEQAAAWRTRRDEAQVAARRTDQTRRAVILLGAWPPTR
jgi:tetratricopeptide (TPR) repeat protein